jgi:acyl-CoA thioesterase-1
VRVSSPGAGAIGPKPLDADRTGSGAAAPRTGGAAAGQRAIVTMLGDSITAGYGLSAAQSLPIQLEAALRDLGVPARVRSAGVSGDTTAGGLARVDFSVQDDTDVAVVALGGNDMLQGTDPGRVRANLDAIVRKLKARGMTVVLAGMMGPPQFGSYTQTFNRIYPDLAEQHGTYLYPFLLNGVALVERYNQRDGIHPNAEGARLIAAGLAPVVAAAIRREPVTVRAVAEATTN